MDNQTDKDPTVAASIATVEPVVTDPPAVVVTPETPTDAELSVHAPQPPSPFPEDQDTGGGFIQQSQMHASPTTYKLEEVNVDDTSPESKA